MALAQSGIGKIDEVIEDRHPPGALPEIKTMLKIISFIGWANLLIGLPSILLIVNLHSLHLVATGILAVLTFRLQRMMTTRISQSKNWAEIGVMAMCGVYFPCFILWICGTNLLEAILH